MAILSTIRYKLKQDIQQEMLSRYMVKCLNILMENSAVPAGYYSDGEVGSYFKTDYDDLINQKPRKVQKEGQAKKSIREKLR